MYKVSWQPQRGPGASAQTHRCTSSSGGEFLVRRLGKHGLLLEVGGQVAKSLGNGVEGALGEVAAGGSAPAGPGVTVVNASHHEQLLGH